MHPLRLLIRKCRMRDTQGILPEAQAALAVALFQGGVAGGNAFTGVLTARLGAKGVLVADMIVGVAGMVIIAAGGKSAAALFVGTVSNDVTCGAAVLCSAAQCAFS
jgi:hypothetical protein